MNFKRTHTEPGIRVWYSGVREGGKVNLEYGGWAWVLAFARMTYWSNRGNPQKLNPIPHTLNPIPCLRVAWPCQLSKSFTIAIAGRSFWHCRWSCWKTLRISLSRMCSVRRSMDCRKRDSSRKRSIRVFLRLRFGNMAIRFAPTFSILYTHSIL